MEGEGSKRKTQGVQPDPKALEAFHELKTALTEAPFLVYANFSQPFLWETDTSSKGLGAVLSQKKEDGQFHPVTYGVRVPRSLLGHHSTFQGLPMGKGVYGTNRQ